VLAPRGVKVVQRVRVEYRWTSLLLAVGPLGGALRWAWLARLRQGALRPILAEWRLDGVVGDRAPSHRGKQLAELATRRVYRPPYSPELNPAERVFAELRREVEGLVDETLAAKQAAAERLLRELAADPQRGKRLGGWDWLQQALTSLPEPPSHAAD
jgi:hypothetical protein